MAINSKAKGANGKFVGKENKFDLITEESICEIYLGNEKIATIDMDDYEKIRKSHWYKGKNGYIYETKTMKLLHRFIMNASKGIIIDHINRDKTDNRKNNLRVCNKSQNAYNSKVKETNTTKVTGVWFRRDTGKWVAEIKHNYKKINLGCYKEKTDAIKARKEAELMYCKEFIPMEVQNDKFKEKRC